MPRRLLIASLLLLASREAAARNWLDPVRAAGPAPQAQGCTDDSQCPERQVCMEGVCKPVQHRTNILFLYLHEENFTELLFLYWHKKGTTGYRVVAPFYWHFWNPGGKARIVAPFYWRFEDYARQRTLTFVLNVSWSREPGAGSFAVWPLFYRSNRYGWALPLLGSFKLAEPDRQSAFGAIFFAYWWKRSPERSWDVSPLFFSRRSPDRTFTWIFPFNFHWRTGSEAHTLAIPLLYRERHRTGATTVTPAGYHSSEGGNFRGSLLWIYWYGNTNQDKHDVVFPLVWSFRSPDRSTTVAGPWIGVRRPAWSFRTFLPVYWSGEDREARSSFTTLIPFFHWQTSDGGGKRTLVTPLGGYRRNDGAGSVTSAFLVPPFFHRRDPARQVDVIAALFWRWKDAASGATTWLSIIPPLFHSTDPTGSSTSFFPFFWRFRDTGSGATATALWPIFARRRGPGDTSTFVGPFPFLGAYRRSFADGGWSAGLAPVAFFGSRPDRGHGVVFPLFWRMRDEDSTTTVAAPLYYRYRDPRQRHAGVPPLLYFHGERDGESYRFQFPLFWRFASAKQGWTTTVIPPLYIHNARDRWSAGLAPLVFAGGGAGGSHFVVAPVFWRFRAAAADRTTTVVPPFLFRSHGGETTLAAFPFVHARWGARPGEPDETSLTLFPLVHYRRDPRQTLFLSPVASWSRTAQSRKGFVLPYFWYDTPSVSASGVFPLHFDVTSRTANERTRMFGPLFLVDGPGRHSRFLVPFWGSHEDAGERDTYVFPNFFHRRKADGYALDTLFPLYWSSSWRERGVDAGTLIVGPWYRRRTAAAYSTGLPPAWFYSKNDTRSWLAIPPLLTFRLRDFRNHTTTLSSLLFFYRNTRPQGHTTNVFPFVWLGRHEERNHQVVFPVFWRFANSKDDSAWTLAGPVYWSHSGTRHTYGLAPFIWHSSDPSIGSTTNALLPIFYEKHDPASLRWLTPIAGYSASSADNSRWWYVLPFFKYESVETSFHTFAPLWFRHVDKANETRTTVIPPLLAFSRSTPSSSLTTAALLFWRFRDVGSSTTLGIPFYFDSHRYAESRTTVFFPLVFRHRREADDTTYWLAPFYYARSAPESSTTVGFPLFWHFKAPDRVSTVGFPFYWRFRRGGDDTHVYFFPLVWNFKRADHESWFVVNTYYKKGLGPAAGTYRFFFIPLIDVAAKRPGDFTWEFLGGLAGYERVGRNRFGKIFFINFDLDPAPAPAQTAWYGKPTAVARTSTSRSLSTATW